jgi:hypothetical protein
MIARLERDVHGRATCCTSGIQQGGDFGVGATGKRMVSLADNRSVPDDYCAYHRIRARRTRSETREIERAAHIGFV